MPVRKKSTKKAPARKRATRATKRKVTTKRKKTSKKKASKASSSAMRSLATYYDPFCGLHNQPRIPDGKASASLGHQLECINEVNTALTGSLGENGVTHMLLFPGLNACLAVVDSQESVANYGASDVPMTYRLADGVLINWSGLSDSTGGTMNYISNVPAYWRQVSCGLKLNLLNPVEEDDGWFEACRVTYPLNADDWILHETNGGKSAARLTGAFSPLGVLQDLRTDQIVNQSSYISGELRDLKHHQFRLNPMSEHKFIHSAERQYFLGTEIPAIDGINSVCTFLQGGSNVEDALNKHIDFQFDMVYIRIHGRSTGTPTRLLAHVVSNQEIMYDNDSTLSRYHQQPDDKMDIESHSDLLRRQHGGSAAEPVSSGPGK